MLRFFCFQTRSRRFISHYSSSESNASRVFRARVTVARLDTVQVGESLYSVDAVTITAAGHCAGPLIMGLRFAPENVETELRAGRHLGFLANVYPDNLLSGKRISGSVLSIPIDVIASAISEYLSSGTRK